MQDLSNALCPALLLELLAKVDVNYMSDTSHKIISDSWEFQGWNGCRPAGGELELIVHPRS